MSAVGAASAIDSVAALAISTAQQGQQLIGGGGKKESGGGGGGSNNSNSKKKNKAGSGAAADEKNRVLELTPAPEFIDHRIRLFERKKAEYDAWAASQPRADINVTLADGRVQVGKAWETRPADVARSISKSLFERTVIARVDDELWDLERPLEQSGRLELLDFDHADGKKVFWHSSAHLLGEAAERRFGCHLCIGPPVDDGFYYEMAMPDGSDAAVQQSDYRPLEAIAAKAVKDRQPFERLLLSKDELLEMFQSNKYKLHLIRDKIADGTSATVYRCGPLIDLCRGPHVPHTGRIKAFQIMRVSKRCCTFHSANTNTPLGAY